MHRTTLSALLLAFLPSLIGAAPTPDVAPAILERRHIYGDTANDVTDGTPCRPVTVIFARGTIELGNLGLLAGPPFLNALSTRLGDDSKLAVQGVPYAANIPGYLAGGDAAGSQNLASLTEQAVSQCPDTQVVLAGYSQGAQLVHNGAALLKPETSASVKAVVVFGDPFEGRPMPNIDPSIVDTFCFAADLICEDTIIVDAAHFAYAIDAGPAADFVAGKVKV